MKKKILIIDGNAAARESLEEAVSAEGYAVQTAASSEEGIRRVEENCPDAVILEERLADMGGIETLQKIHDIKPKLQAVMLTRRGTIDGAVSAIKAGASDYIPKPPELSRLMLRLKEAVGQ